MAQKANILAQFKLVSSFSFSLNFKRYCLTPPKMSTSEVYLIVAFIYVCSAAALAFSQQKHALRPRFM